MASVTDQISKILNEYSEEVDEVVRKDAKKAADKTARKLKSSSPKRKGGYAQGWRVKSTATGILTGYTVYNAKKPGLTHLLEHGHLSRNQYGTYGRVGGRAHIKPAEAEGIREFEAMVRQDL